MDPSILQRIIDGFTQALDPGLGRMRPFFLMWISFLVLLEATRVYGLVLVEGRGYQHLVGFLARTLMLAVVYWGWPTILNTLVEDSVNAGLRFMGATLTIQQVMDPGLLMQVGLNTAVPLKDILWANLGLTTPVQACAFLVCWILYVVAYGVMSANILLAQIEMAVVVPVSLIALGFIFFAPTRQMAAGVLSYGLNLSFRFFLQAILATIIFQLAPILFPPLPRSTAFTVAIEQAVIMVLAAVILAVLFLKIPSVTSHHLAGTPMLSAGSLLQTVAGLAGMATGATMFLRSHGPAWNIRQPPPVPRLTGGTTPPRLLAPVRSGQPAMPALHALNSTLRSGAQYLSHDQGGGGAHVSL